jgi:hypothetical protein
MSERDIDAEFDAIIAHWDDDAAAPARPHTVQDITAAYAALSRPETDPEPAVETDPEPAAETVVGDDPAVPASRPPAPPPPAEPAAAAPPDASAGAHWRAGPRVDAEDDDHFEPAPVQLPPGEDLGYWGAIVGLVGGPLLMVWVALTGPFYRGWWILGSIVLFLGGFALLVLRQPRDRDPWDDDGARV